MNNQLKLAGKPAGTRGEEVARNCEKLCNRGKFAIAGITSERAAIARIAIDGLAIAQKLQSPGVAIAGILVERVDIGLIAPGRISAG